MATVILPFTAVDGNGNVRANAKLYFYMTGTTTPQNTYTDAALSVTATNPVVADSNGLFHATYLGDPPTFVAYKMILKTSADVTVETTDPIAGAPITAPLSSSLLRSYLAGLNKTTRTNTTLSLGAGVAMDDTNTTMLSLAAGTINCATVGADGLDAGALANSTWYHTFAIGKTDGTVARLASTSVSSPTMPSGYTLKRRIGSFKTNGSAQILDFIQDGDLFQWVAMVIADVTAANPGTAAVTRTLAGVPTGVNVQALLQVILANSGAGGGVTAYFSDLATNDIAASQSVTIVGDFPSTIAAAGGVAQSDARMTIRTNTSAQIRSRLSFSDGNVTFALNSLGWIDRRGRDD